MAKVNDIAIDLSTSTIQIYVKGKGIVLKEPTIVAINRETRSIISYGDEAYRLVGR